MEKNRKIAIVGAGLTGSLLGIYLGRRGFSVDIFEKRPDMRNEDIPAGRSINLAISTRGLDALEQAGLKEAIAPHVIPMYGRMIHNQDSSLSYQPYSRNSGEFINALSRATLNCILMDHAEKHPSVRIHFYRRAERFDPAAGILHLHDETSGEAVGHATDIVLGGDGFASAIRNDIMSLTGGKCAEHVLDHSYKELFIQGDGKGGFRMEENALHIWPRGSFMLIALPNKGGSFTVTLFMPNAVFDGIKTEKDLMDFFAANFPDAVAHFPHLAKDFFGNPNGILGYLTCSPWSYSDKALVIGDSAHAIVPFYGQGMNCCFEDVVVFDRLLGEKPGDFEEVFREFYRIRKPDADAICELALENYIEMRDLTSQKEFHKKKSMERRLNELYPDLFIPAYSLVTFSHEPYSFAKNCKSIQDELLSAMAGRFDDVSGMTAENTAPWMSDYRQKVRQLNVPAG